MYDIRVMTGDIGLPIRKLLENTLLYPIIGQTKTMKLLLTRLKTKHNVIVLRHHNTVLHPKKVVMQHPFQLYQQGSPFYSF
jgi:hypothetical protein